MKNLLIILVTLITLPILYAYSQGHWIQKANIGVGGRVGAFSFSIANKGYIGAGAASSVNDEFWEYDPISNVWTQKANVGNSYNGWTWDRVGFSLHI